MKRSERARSGLGGREWRIYDGRARHLVKKQRCATRRRPKTTANTKDRSRNRVEQRVLHTSLINILQPVPPSPPYIFPVFPFNA